VKAKRSLWVAEIVAVVSMSVWVSTGVDAGAPPPMPPGPEAASATAGLVNADGSAVGVATFRRNDHGLITVQMQVTGLPSGDHAVHVHERGECAPGPDPITGEVIPFGKAGGHFDPETTRNHGRPEHPAEHAHGGDLPVVSVGGDGRGTLVFDTQNDLALDQGERSILGRSMVVHQNGDDYESEPAGGSGPRVACGVIIGEPTTATGRFALPGGSVYPEGIAVGDDGTAYVGSSANGNIYRINEDGSVETFALGGSAGRTSALGLNVVGDRLMIAGGSTGTVTVLDRRDAQPIARIQSPASPQPFINDMTVAADGYVYVTDSNRPVLWRFRVDATGSIDMERWLDLTTTPIAYANGVNLNGIVADGNVLYAVQSNTGKLWRIDVTSRGVTEIDVAGTDLSGGDGLAREGNSMMVVRNGASEVVELDLDPGGTRASVKASRVEPTLQFPTTLARWKSGWLVVDGQLDRRTNGFAAVQPFRVWALADWLTASNT
jgi:superoxide dismutase, Cu-Zn family